MAVDAPFEDDRRPVRLVFSDPSLERSRLTVFFRLLLAFPLLVWAGLWGIAVVFALVVLWLAVVFTKKVPDGLHDFVAGYVRYGTQVSAYVLLAADPYPWFKGSDGYDVDLEIDPPVEQSRLSGFFRLLLALPALLLSLTLGGGIAYSAPGSSNSGTTGEEYAYYAGATLGGVASVAAFLAWFAILARGREPRGLRDVTALALGYSAQALSYAFLLTPRYPSSDPALAEPYSELPEHPVRVVTADDDVSQSRLTVFFRLLLTIPHFLFLFLWAILALGVVVVAWFAALVTGRVPASLHRFLCAFLRYGTHVGAYLYLLGRRFPGFTGQPGTYEVDLELDASARQSRWKTFFRFFLAIPALILASALDGVLAVVGILGWFYALVTGRMPDGMRNLGISCLRYSTQTYAYLLLVTDRYPYAGPVLRQRPEPAEEPAPPALGEVL